MKKRCLRAAALAAAVCCLVLMLCGCKSDIEKDIEKYSVGYSAVQNPDWQALLEGEEFSIAQTVVSSADAFNRYDADDYMSYIHPESSVFETTREDIEWIASYALKTDIEDVSILWCDGEKALVGVTQLTYQVGEARFEYITTRTAAIHSMVLEEGKWYFVESVVVSDVDVTDNWDPFFEIIDDYS